MSTEPVEKLDAALIDLIGREKQGYSSYDDLKSHVLERVELGVALRAGTPAGAPNSMPPQVAATAANSIAKIIRVAVAAFSVGAVVGGGAAVAIVQRPVPSVAATSETAVLPTASTSASAASIDELVPTPPNSLSVPDASTTAFVPKAATHEVPSTTGDLAKERELLDVARAALARGRPLDAIAVAEQHAAKWPHGLLAEEREVVLIEALVSAKRVDEAKTRAIQFNQQYPNSMLASAVELAIDGAEHD